MCVWNKFPSYEILCSSGGVQCNYRSAKRFFVYAARWKNINRISNTVIKYLLIAERIGGFTKSCKEGVAFCQARLTIAR